MMLPMHRVRLLDSVAKITKNCVTAVLKSYAIFSVLIIVGLLEFVYLALP